MVCYGKPSTLLFIFIASLLLSSFSCTISTPSLSVYISLPVGDKEKFVTAAYKEKLAEMGRWKAEDSRLQALEAATTVCI
jgi:hypothetical protein